MDAIFRSLEPGSLICAHTISQSSVKSSKVQSELLMSSFTSILRAAANNMVCGHA